MKLVGQIFIAVLLALLVKDQIDLLALEYRMRIAAEKLTKQQEARRQVQIEREIQERKLNAPQSDIRWSENEANNGNTKAALDGLIREGN